MGKECSYEKYPNLKIELIGNISYRDQYLIRYDASTYDRIDSISFEGEKLYLYHHDYDLRNEIYHIHSNNHVDTISNINYDIYTFYNKCNSGFMNNKGGDAIDFSDLTIELNGLLFRDTEIIKLYH